MTVRGSWGILIVAAWAVLFRAPALAGEEEGEEGASKYETPSASEARKITEYLARIPVPQPLRKDLGIEDPKTGPAKKAPTFEEDPAYHLSQDENERKTIRENLAKMKPKERAEFLKKKKKELEKKLRDRARKRQLSSEDFASEGTGPPGMTPEEFRKHYDKAREKLEKESRAAEDRAGAVREFFTQRREAVLALKAYGQKTTPFLAAALQKADLDTGRILVDIAATIPDDPRAHPATLAWLERLRFQKPLRDERFLSQLGKMEIPGIIPALETALYRTRGLNRGAFLRGLFAARSPNQIAESSFALLRFLEKGDRDNKELVLNLLSSRLADKRVPDGTKLQIINTAAEIAQHPDFRNVAVSLTLALGRSGHAAAVQPLIRFLDHDDPRVCQYAIRGLGLLGPKALAAGRTIVKFLDTGKPENLKQEAVETLGRIGDESAVWALIDLLYEEDSPLIRRQSVVRALQRITKSGKGFGANAMRWANWWEAELKRRESR
ncbi:MAG: HEAT repeat domain-containing protein [Planctomycetota bacterium]